jgi:hypothetical protein
MSNFYEVQECKILDYDHKERQDTALILSPLSLIPTPEKGGVCIWQNNDIVENRLLLIKTCDTNNKPVISIYPDAISNQATIAWQGYESIESLSKGFQLHAVKGQGYVIEYFIRVIQQENSFYIQEINLSRTAPFKEKILRYKPMEFPLEKYNRSLIDSLRIIYDM